MELFFKAQISSTTKNLRLKNHFVAYQHSRFFLFDFVTINVIIISVVVYLGMKNNHKTRGDYFDTVILVSFITRRCLALRAHSSSSRFNLDK